MVREKSSYLRVFLASASDVEEEKEIAYKTANNINEILGVIGDNLLISIPSLQVSGHEANKDDIEIQNQVTYERCTIEESDIFICILWRTLETLSIVQSMTGNAFLSVKEEFIRAIKQKAKNSNGRPVIMLYRKIDDFPITSKDARQTSQSEKIDRFFKNVNQVENTQL